MEKGAGLSISGHMRESAARSVVFFGGLLFVFTALSKSVFRQEFREALVAQDVVPPSLVDLVAMVFPVVELFIGFVCLLAAVITWRVRAAAMALALSMLFLTVYAVALVVDPPREPAPCACGFGGAPLESWRPIVYRNSAIGAVFVGVSMLCRGSPRKSRSAAERGVISR